MRDVRGPRSRSVVALTGSTGFIGSAILDALIAADYSVLALSRQDSPYSGANVERVVARDGLGDVVALRHLMQGADVLVHAASYVGADADLQEGVNVNGTLRLVSEAQRQGVSRIIYVSTAAVYGSLVHNGAKEGELERRPRTSLSASRVQAEDIVLESGGVILRPQLVYGEGDQWFLGQYVAMTEALGAWVNGGTAKVSVIDRKDLGRLVVRLLSQEVCERVLHACYPDPMPICGLALQVFRHGGVKPPIHTIPPDQALSTMAPLGVRESQIAMVATDHWLSSKQIWEVAGMTPQAHPQLDAAALDWYARTFLSRR